MLKPLNKGISSAVGILIILICTILVGGILIWQLEQEEKETKVSGEEIIPPENETADWKTYRNKEYGFEVKYPATMKVISSDGAINFKKGETILYNLIVSTKTKPRISNKVSNPECYKETDVKTLNDVRWDINDFLCGSGAKTYIYYSTTHNDYVFEISFSSDNLVNKMRELEQMFSTFRFLK